ncbi:MAG: maltodextrin phosphorylase [delta proteobacterium ML8_F1]|nr:MAG: maltodextrin phosphorylase [delta proteobacterium ML8_F1]
MEFDKKTFKKEYIKKVEYQTARDFKKATDYEKYFALGTYLKDRIVDRWIQSTEKQIHEGLKQVYYFSMEFLTGRFLINNLYNIGLYAGVKEALGELGIDLETIAEIEKDPGLGNGGLGRLAAGFLDSLASKGYSGHGMGIRYNYGLFEQKIVNGYQVEYPDRWLSSRNVWEIKREDEKLQVRFRGVIEPYEEDGKLKFRHYGYDVVAAVPYDTPVIGYDNQVINTLRLFSSESLSQEFDYSKFSQGEYHTAFEKKHEAEAISQVLYPNDTYYEGKLLRLKQEYFLVSAGIQSIVRDFKRSGKELGTIHQRVAIHINDTHPALCVPEFMRILLDEEAFEWDQALDLTRKVMSYTNHTILKEALEIWPLGMIRDQLPRIAMIIEELDRRVKADLAQMTGPLEEEEKQVIMIIRDDHISMANMLIHVCHSVNGVAKIHTEILKTRELREFFKLYPHKFNNKTNGISHRRWLIHSNPELTAAIDAAIGEQWKRDPLRLEGLLKYREDPGFLSRLEAIKLNNKRKLAQYIQDHNGITVNPHSIFDIQAKRLHEYKRQTMNIFHIMYLYNQLIENPGLDITPRTFIFGAKAAPGYHVAKQTIKLIHSLGEKINRDQRIRDSIKVVFLENYGVSLAQKIIPAADVSEQISTASKEASGTGNMKFMMNGAVTMGTMDGANVEIKEAVGPQNIYIFGTTARDVYEIREKNSYRAIEYYERLPHLKEIVDQLTNGFFPGTEGEFDNIQKSILHYNDEFLVLKDFEAYRAAQEKLSEDYLDALGWAQKTLVNIAKSGIFSSDYTIDDYAKNIWGLGADFHE